MFSLFYFDMERYVFRSGTITIDIKRLMYEEFLKKLLQKPVLKGSELLYMFLTTQQDFSLIVTTAAVPIGDLGNIYQSVAYKLRKEKGQHLDSFMNTFLASTGKLKQKYVNHKIYMFML